MNSKSTTLPRYDDKVILCPVKPLGPTTGNVKSGTLLDWESEAVEEYDTVRLVEVEDGCVNE
jgi:hypothetical protein